jgi:hypothetical protein
VEALLLTVARRITRLVKHRGIDLDRPNKEDAIDEFASESPLLAGISGASVFGRAATGGRAGEMVRDGKILLNMRRAWHDGTRAILFEPHQLIERLAALIPKPRMNLLLYHGVLGPSTPLRSDAVAAGGASTAHVRNRRSGVPRVRRAGASSRYHRGSGGGQEDPLSSRYRYRVPAPCGRRPPPQTAEFFDFGAG